MSNTVIRVENLFKNYRLGQIGTGTLRDDLKVWWAKVRGKPNPLLKIGEPDHGNKHGEELWALQDVSFTVEQGEVLGIIGRNGAGKSTLLKILSRVTAPTFGLIKVKGRIASLLEVGTGFHPDLTGRENIYLNGAILGMKKNEIRSKFDEIVDFSEIGQFIDTPVKRYSSGMYVRLAFAVAAHLEPEILIVDEVLAVGDIAFQKKCLGKMGDVSRHGRTVLFVSHNMAAVEALCPRVMILDVGRMVYDGQSSQGITKYLAGKKSPLDAPKKVEEEQNLEFISSYRVLDRKFAEKDSFQIGEPIIFEVSLKPNDKLKYPVIGIGINDQRGTRITTMLTDHQGIEIPALNKEMVVRCEVSNLALAPGLYGIKIAVSSHYEEVEKLELADAFEVISSNYWGAGRMIDKSQGFILVKPAWKVSSRR